MESKVLALFLALVLTHLASGLTLAQTSSSTQQPTTNVNAQDWQGLGELAHGKKIMVEFTLGTAVEGKLVGLSGSTLTLADDGDIYAVEQRDIQRVYRLKGRWSRGTAARIGAGIGMTVGLIRGTEMVVNSPRQDHRGAVVGMALGTLIGAGVGALLGGKRRGKLLYEAK